MNRRSLIALLCGAFAALLPGVSAAQEATLTLEVTAPLLSLARVGSWLPIQVELNSSVAREGRIVVSCSRGSCPATERKFTLPAGSQHRFEIPVEGRGWAGSWRVEVLDPQSWTWRPMHWQLQEPCWHMTAATVLL